MVILGATECRIAGGLYHSLVVDEPSRENDGVYSNNVYGFGSNRNRMLDRDERNVFYSPKAIGFFDDKLILAVGCGDSFSVFLEKHRDQDGGSLWVVGLGISGRLGLRRPRSRGEYEDLLLASGYRADEVSSLLGDCGKLLDTSTQSWHVPVPVQLPKLENVVALSCGADHSLALTDGGAVYAWGLGSFGNLGTGSTDDAFAPALVRIPDDRPCSMVAAGTKHSMALTREGGVMYSWGHGGNGRLGQGDRREASLVPNRVHAEERMAARCIAAGEAHSAAIDALGNVFCWGAGTRGRTGHGEEIDYPVPKQVRSLGGTPCSEVALGALHSIALAQSGALHTWGTGCATGHDGVAGAEPVQPIPQELTHSVLRRARVQHIAAGSFHSLALLEGGFLVAWGNGSQGRLGLGPLKVNDRDVPELVPLRQDRAAEAPGAAEPEAPAAPQQEQRLCRCGGMHSALLAGGDLWLWGSNEHGQLGFGDRLDRALPAHLLIKEIALTKASVDSVALGLEHCVVLTSPASTGARLLFSWGRNRAGQLGLGNNLDERKPKQISFIVDAKAVAVGEDHSAAILSSGELYTWGSADSGKLGHGSAGGSQNYPRLVRLGDQLEHVCCGAQHTAILNTQGLLFTFGAGWFGRLGHGDTSNQTSPKLVERFQADDLRTGPLSAPSGEPIVDVPAPRVGDVQCGMYHTCIVTADRQLWCCGRDSMICEPAHVLRPVRFGWGASAQAEELKVQCLAVGASHTLCLVEGGGLWAWGENGKGQLGLGGGAGSRLLAPATLAPAEWAADGVAALAAGHAHSLALLRSGELYAWGCSAGGRLGLAEAEPGSGAAWRPARVSAQWDEQRATDAALEAEEKVETSVAAEAEPEGGREGHDGHEGELFALGELQRKLQREPYEHKVPALRLREEDLTGQLSGFFQEICGLWEPARPGQTTEFELEDLQVRLDRSLCKNLRRLQLSDEYPNLDDLQLHHRVAQVLSYYEELVWVLQQQPCYLARFSQMKKHHHQAHEMTRMPEIFNKVVGQIFREMGDSRIRHHLMALIRRMIALEVQRPEATESMSTDWIFDYKTSRLHAVLGTLVQHPHFKDFHRKLFDAEDEGSLLSKVSHWTLKRGAHSEVGIFAMEVADIFEWENAGDENLMSEKERAEQLAHLRSRLQEHQKVLQQFLGTQTAGANTFVSFVEKLHLGEELQALLVRAAECIRRYVSAHEGLEGKEAKAVEGQLSRTDRRVYEPIMRLLLASVFGHLLEHHESIMTSQMLSEKFKRWLRGIVEEQLKLEHGEPDDHEVDEALADAVKRMHFNLNHLGRFLQMAARRDFKPGQGNLQTFAGNLAGSLVAFCKRQAETGADDLATRLTVDLYTSHLDSAEHFVMMKTSDLLHLSNALWHHVDRVVEAERPQEDRLYQLLDRIQPPAKAPEDKRLWPPEVLRTEEAHDMMHNFTVSHRFLQLNARADLCFCQACEVALPRALAPEGQRQQRGRELLKLYPDFADQRDVLELGSVIASRELSVDLRQAKTFASLYHKLEEAQKAINQKMKGMQGGKSTEAYAFLTEIERGKSCLDRLRAQGFTIQTFTDYLEDALRGRERHFRYLQSVQEGLDVIKDHRRSYFDQLALRTQVLRRFVVASESVSVPPLLRNKASDQGVRLKLIDVERLRQKEEKSDKDFGGSEAPRDMYASATFSLFNLIAKKVVRRMGGDLPPKEHRNIIFTFNQMEIGHWEVVAIHQHLRKSHMLCTFEITSQDIKRMKKAGKHEKREFNNGFVVMSCFNLLQLLARIRAMNFKG